MEYYEFYSAICPYCGERHECNNVRQFLRHKCDKKFIDVDPKKNGGERMKNKWDVYFYGICEAVSLNSKCLSRKIGAILVRDHALIATGYNGPPLGIPHCDSYSRRFYLAKHSSGIFKEKWIDTELDKCPRFLMGCKSGEGLIYCIASHAERNLLNQCARLGVAVKGSTLYMNAEVLPCKECLIELIQAQIKEVVCLKAEPYNDIEWLAENSEIRFREFYL